MKVVDERPVECAVCRRNCKSCITLLSLITRHLAVRGWIVFHRAADIKEIAVERPPGLAGSTAGSMFGQIPVRLITGFPHPPSPPTTPSELEGNGWSASTGFRKINK